MLMTAAAARLWRMFGATEAPKLPNVCVINYGNLELLTIVSPLMIGMLLSRCSRASSTLLVSAILLVLKAITAVFVIVCVASFVKLATSLKSCSITTRLSL